MKTSFFKILIVGLLLSFTASMAIAEIPTGYYSILNGKSGRDLKNAVHNLIRPHNVVTYGSLWYYFSSTDCRLDDRSKVWDMYSDKTFFFRGSGSASGMNREHSLPKSWWGGTQVEAYTDLNHLYPSDAVANTAKLHYPLGEVSSITFDNGVTKVGTPVTGQGGGSAMVFEPDDQYKGDFARTYFYMATCYQDYTWKYKYMLTENEWLTLNKWSIDLLLKWAREDPVSAKEQYRNEEVYKIQNNRNPFIDNPELMEYIWGNKAGMPYSPADPDPDDPDQTARLIVPTQDLKIQFGEVGLGKSLQTTVYIKGKHLTGNLSALVLSGDKDMFKLSVNQIPNVTAMSELGYPLVITYTPANVGQHKCRLIIYDGGITGSVGAELNASCLPKPNLTTPTALPAQNITSTSYTACWASVTEDIDYYIINRTIYDETNTIVSREKFTTEETTYVFDDLEAGQTHTYTVQSSRLGYTSEESNVITLNTSAIDGISATMPVAFLAMDGAVVVKCSEPLGDVNIYSVNGSLVRHFDRVNNDDIIALPRGVYVFSSGNGSFRPAKLIIK